MNTESFGPDNPHPLFALGTELVWEGKYDEFGERRELDRTAMSMPLQKIETIDEPRARAEAQGDLFDVSKSHLDDFRNLLIWGDNRLVASSLLRDFSGAIDLIYIDPPFDVGADFGMKVAMGDSSERVQKEQSALEFVAYRDTWGKGSDSYLQMMSDRLTLFRELLTENGTIFLHCDWHASHYLRALMEEVFGRDGFLNEIVWRYRRWPTKTRSFQKMHDVIFWYGKSPEKQHKFNQLFDDLAPSTVETWGTNKQIADFSSGRRKPSQTDEESEGAPMADVWDIGVIAPIANERVGFETQKPEALLERIITSASEPGDLVADFFCGSGTTGAVAERLGRRWIMADLGRFAVHTGRKRLIEVQRQLHKEDQPYRAFDVFNLGRYERQWWQKEALSGADEEHRRVVLDFYRAEPLTKASSPLLHGSKGATVCHVDDIDSVFTRREMEAVAAAARGAGARSLTCLAWEFEMDLRMEADRLQKENDMEIRLIQIPREIMEKNRTSPPPFLEVATLEAKPVIKDGTVEIEITRFLPSLSEVPAKEVESLRERAMESGFDFIDFWAVDFDYHEDQPFHHDWQDYRVRQDRSLKTVSEQSFKYDKPGKYTACVKVIDIFGADTSITVPIEYDG